MAERRVGGKRDECAAPSSEGGGGRGNTSKCSTRSTLIYLEEQLWRSTGGCLEMPTSPGDTIFNLGYFEVGDGLVFSLVKSHNSSIRGGGVGHGLTGPLYQKRQRKGRGLSRGRERAGNKGTTGGRAIVTHQMFCCRATRRPSLRSRHAAFEACRVQGVPW